MKKTSSNRDIDVFQKKLKAYKQLIDDDITAYVRTTQKTTLQEYGANARLASDAYTSILERGGKRIRGSLVMLGYEMSGGKDTKMILQAARAVEMIHAYILIIDDIQDRSVTRRGGPTAHILLSDYHHRHQLADDEHHFGIAMALNAALTGGHAAQAILSKLDVSAELRNDVVAIMNHTMVITAHGQTNDIMNEVVAEVSDDDIERVLEWKTAHYTFLNPLQIGMVLAGASSQDIDAIGNYALHAGKAFQITDDILGVFGTEFESGKSPLDDIREGKRTVLTAYALKHTDHADKNFLIQILGNQNITQAEFGRTKDILEESGALTYAQQQAESHVAQAIAALQPHKNRWNDEGTQFLTGLAMYLITRTS